VFDRGKLHIGITKKLFDEAASAELTGRISHAEETT